MRPFPCLAPTNHTTPPYTTPQPESKHNVRPVRSPSLCTPVARRCSRKVLTMKRQIKHMIKHKYVPWNWGKAKYADSNGRSRGVMGKPRKDNK